MISYLYLKPGVGNGQKQVVYCRTDRLETISGYDHKRSLFLE